MSAPKFRFLIKEKIWRQIQILCFFFQRKVSKNANLLLCVINVRVLLFVHLQRGMNRGARCRSKIQTQPPIIPITERNLSFLFFSVNSLNRIITIYLYISLAITFINNVSNFSGQTSIWHFPFVIFSFSDSAFKKNFNCFNQRINIDAKQRWHR